MLEVRSMAYVFTILIWVTFIINMTEDFSPKALVGVKRLLELLGEGGVAS